jgi:Putative zinc-finger
MDLKCEQVWLLISDYVDGEVAAPVRAEMDRHLKTCARCTSVLAGTKNLVQLYGDERMFSVPLDFSPALHRRLSQQARPERGAAYTWALSLAGTGLATAAMLLFSLPRFTPPTMRAPMSQPALRAPVANLVVVSEDGKTFHVPGCTYIHGKSRMIPVEDAMKEGYNPCIRCEAGLLHRGEGNQPLSITRKPPSTRATPPAKSDFGD